MHFQIVSSTNFTKPLDYNGQPFGTISVQSQEQGGMQKSIKMTLRGVKLDKKDWFGKHTFMSGFIYISWSCSFIF